MVTIDAMGCQRDIASKIIETRMPITSLALKGNQGTLLRGHVTVFVAEQKSLELQGYHDQHGIKPSMVITVAIETRNYDRDPATSTGCRKRHANGPGLKSVVVIIESRREINGDRIDRRRRGFYITSLGACWRNCWSAAMIRAHWAIENGLALGHGHGVPRR